MAMISYRGIYCLLFLRAIQCIFTIRSPSLILAKDTAELGSPARLLSIKIDVVSSHFYARVRAHCGMVQG